MSFITFQCYACGQMLKVGGDKGGRKAKCHKCGTILTIPFSSVVPSPAAPPQPPARQAPPTDHVVPPTAVTPPLAPTPVAAIPVAPFEGLEDVPRPRRRQPREEYEDEESDVQRPADLWWRAKLGLLLVFIGACVLAGAFALEVIAYLLMSINIIRDLVGARPGGGTENVPGVLLRVSLFIDLAASITAGVGYVFAILGPRKRGALGLAIAITAVAGVRLLLLLIFKLPVILGSLTHLGPGGLNMGFFTLWFMWLLIQLLFAAEFILFALYMRSLSLLLKDNWNVSGCNLTLILGCVYAGERLITFIFAYLVFNAIFSPRVAAFGQLPQEPSKAMAWITLILLWLGAFLFAGLLVMYILRIWRTRNLID
jgi:hypothetical protein